MKRYQKSMLEGPLFSSIVVYTIPIILTSILQLLFNAADLIVVGRFCGSVSVAAVGATGSITNLIVTLFVGLSVGAGVSMAHAMGSRDDAAIHRTVHTAMPTALISGVVLTVVGVAFSETFLQWMETPEDVLPLSAVYMRIYFGGITFNMIYNFCAAILRAAGDTKSPLIFLTIAGVFNVMLNLLFVAVFQMNVAGVAWATTISQALSAVLVVWALMRRTDASRLDLRKMRFYKVQLVKIVGHGLPAGFQNALFSISNVLIQSSVNSFGDMCMSGNAAASNIEGFNYVSMNAFCQTALNFTGQNVGARQYKRVGKIMGICLVCVAVVGFSVGITSYLLAPYLLPVYIPDSAEAVAYGYQRMAFVSLPYFLMGMMDVCTGVLRGMGASIMPTIVTLLGICGLRIAWIYTIFQIPQYHTYQFLYLSYPVSWLLTLIVQFAICIFLYRKRVHMQSLV